MFPVQVSLSLSPGFLGILVLSCPCQVGGGPGAQGAGVGLLRQQGGKLRRAQSQQPLDTTTPQDTHSGHSREHSDDVASWLLGDSQGIHTDRYTLQHAQLCPEVHKDAEGHRRYPGITRVRTHAHTHTLRHTHPGTGTPGHTSAENPGPWACKQRHTPSHRHKGKQRPWHWVTPWRAFSATYKQE